MASTAAWSLLLLPLVQAIEPARFPRQPVGNGTTPFTFNDTVPSSRYVSSLASISWVAGDVDGQYITENDDGALVFENIATGDSQVLVDADAIPEDYWEYWTSPEADRVLWATNYTKQYRYSYFADYLVQDVESGELTPLVEDQAGDIQYAEFAPTGGAIAFVRGNNLYISNGSEVTQVTQDGNEDMFHAVPDWVYEEEIFGSRSTFWWSPDAQYIAFLSFNETGVETFTIPYYMDSSEVAPPYPRELELRYPKVGSINPRVEFNILDLSTMEYENIPIDAFEPNNTVVGEVAWLTEDHSAVIYRVYNRVQDLDKHVLVDPVAKTSEVVRERDGTDGWLENFLAIQYVGAIDDSNETYYVDLSDESGWNHIYLHPVSGGDSMQLTEGEWEVASVYKVDAERQLIYYTSTESHSTERHLYSVSFNGTKTPLVDPDVPAYWSASFSSGGSYYILNYLGPDVPYQELYSINSTTEPLDTITSNAELHANLTALELPTTNYFELEHPDGYTLNVMERLPVGFSPDQQYRKSSICPPTESFSPWYSRALFAPPSSQTPSLTYLTSTAVILLPYGGPNAQEVDKQMMPFNFRYYLSVSALTSSTLSLSPCPLHLPLFHLPPLF